MTLPSPRIGPYVVGRQLGRGGVGVVHAAVPDAAGPTQEVALKLLPGELAHDRAFRSRFTREGRALSVLESPHVLPVRGFGEEAGQLYVASDLVPDGDLERMLRTHGAPPLDLGLQLVLQVAQGLVDAHEAGLVHGALKPANVMLRRDGDDPRVLRACLTDFGTAHGGHPIAPGSARWAAPELHTGAPPSKASDLYSLGCVLWTTLTGEPPYSGATDFQLASAHLHEPPRQLAGGSPLVLELNALLQRSLAKEPSSRPASARQVVDVLRRARSLAGARDGRVMPVPVRSGTGVPVPAGEGRGWRSRLGAAAGLAAALALGVVGTLLLVDRESSAAPAASVGTPRAGEADSLNPEARAVNSIAETFVDELLVDHDNARCIAGRWVEEIGLGRLIAAGFLDEEMGYRERDLEQVDPEIKESLGVATQECLS